MSVRYATPPIGSSFANSMVDLIDFLHSSTLRVAAYSVVPAHLVGCHAERICVGWHHLTQFFYWKSFFIRG